MTEFLNTPNQLAALAELDQLLPPHGVDYWLFGGWAVDFHAGRVTREHADIDIAIWSDDRERAATLLRDRAWIHRPDAGEDGYTCYERNGIRLEVAFLARDERGLVYTPLLDGRGEWPAGSFGDEIAELCGVRARVVGRASLISDKSVIRSDAVTAAKDRADVVRLLQVTLWRGKQLLGDLQIIEQSAEELSAILSPVEDLRDLTGVMQTRLDLAPGSRVFQHPVDPLAVANDLSQRTSNSGRSGPVPLRRLTEVEAQGIAPELQLGIRDGFGAFLSARMILLAEFQFPPERTSAREPEPAGQRLGLGRAWMVVAALDAGVPPTPT